MIEDLNWSVRLNHLIKESKRNMVQFSFFLPLNCHRYYCGQAISFIEQELSDTGQGRWRQSECEHVQMHRSLSIVVHLCTIWKVLSSLDCAGSIISYFIGHTACPSSSWLMVSRHWVKASYTRRHKLSMCTPMRTVYHSRFTMFLSVMPWLFLMFWCCFMPEIIQYNIGQTSYSLPIL